LSLIRTRILKRDTVIELFQVEAALSAVLGSATTAVPDTDYRIVGTAAALMQGVQLPAEDIDVLLRKRAGVDSFSAALSSWRCLSSPTYLESSKQYFASYDIDGVEVEFSTVEGDNESDTGECTGLGPWIHYSLVTCGSVQVPAVGLELRLLTELARGRADRYVPIWGIMQLRGYDRDLVARGLKERGITEAEQLDLAQLWCCRRR
jgi:hypothetical protein